MEELSEILWRERELLGMLLYRLEQEQLVLASGKTRWLATAAGEVEAVLETIRRNEALRAMVADEAAEQLGLSANPSLSQLAARAQEPWSSILLEHRDALLDATRQITELAAENRSLLTAGSRATRDMLLSLSEETPSYAPDGSVVAASQGRRLVDRSI